MSGAQRATRTSSTSNFISVFEAASNAFKKLTGQDLDAHPFSAEFDNCDSPDAVLSIFRKQAEIFDEIRKGDERLIKWLGSDRPYLVRAFSGTRRGSRAVIFAGAGVLLTVGAPQHSLPVAHRVAKDVMASYDTLASLFELMQGFLQRLEIYIGTPLTPAMMEVLGKIMAEVLSVLALVTKEMKQRRFKKYLKRLVGRTDVENALMRLDVLTQREMQMAVARNLEITHGIEDNVKVVKAVTWSVDNNVRAIKEATRTLTRPFLFFDNAPVSITV
ncbi:hypothetical protein EDB84DRAFT_1672444 [Lactarius hengduanensis]|nr:hypothetical protein EDB84DRAFT_1672444 [Lactarius hengduanensis]